jgi:hypothetical protein
MDITLSANRGGISQHPGDRFDRSNDIFFGGSFAIHLGVV